MGRNRINLEKTYNENEGGQKSLEGMECQGGRGGDEWTGGGGERQELKKKRGKDSQMFHLFNPLSAA